MLQHSYDVVDVEQSLGRLTPEDVDQSLGRVTRAVNVVKFAIAAG